MQKDERRGEREALVKQQRRRQTRQSEGYRHRQPYFTVHKKVIETMDRNIKRKIVHDPPCSPDDICPIVEDRAANDCVARIARLRVYFRDERLVAEAYGEDDEALGPVWVGDAIDGDSLREVEEVGWRRLEGDDCGAGGEESESARADVCADVDEGFSVAWAVEGVKADKEFAV